MNLDFSNLSDDQLVELVRQLAQECASRNPAVANASRSALLDEAEKARIRSEASEREAARLRAIERERIAKEAAEEVRRATESQRSAEETERRRAKEQSARESARKTAEAAVREVAEREAEEAAWLKEIAALTDQEPTSISINYFKSRYGVRVIVNPSCDKYDDSHLVDWNAEENKIKTSRSLMSRKPELIGFCARFRERYRKPKGPGSQFLAGCNYDFGKEESNGSANS